MPLPRVPRSLLYPALIATLLVLTLGANAADEATSKRGPRSQRHHVDLMWNASASQDILGYNIYRGNKPGGPYRKINLVLNASTVYTDTSVTDGNTYYYVTTTVNSAKEESAYSNQTLATVP